MDAVILSPDFNLQTARACLEACARTYTGCVPVGKLCHASISEVDVEWPAHTSGGAARIVAFRGSVSAQDWLTDAQFARTEIGAGEEVHHGFLDAIISAEDWLKEIAADSTVKPKGVFVPPLFITGHSLGGAMALLAAKRLAAAGAWIKGVYTFGGPRVGNGTWARNYDKTVLWGRTHSLGQSTWRVVNEEDIVPRVPWAVLGYRHPGHEVFLPSYGSTDYLMDPSLYTKGVSDAVGTWLDWKLGRCAQLVDHHIENYRGRLGECAPQPQEAVNP